MKRSERVTERHSQPGDVGLVIALGEARSVGLVGRRRRRRCLSCRVHSQRDTLD